jgi:poly(beta-D-mannuronate) lyase
MVTAIAVATAALPAAANAAEQVKSFFSQDMRSAPAAKSVTTFKCPTPAPAMVDMSALFAFYKPDHTMSVIDRTKMQALVKRTWPVIVIKKNLSASVVAALNTPSAAAAARACIVKQVDLWASKNAMLGNVATNDPLGHRVAIMTMAWTGVSIANALQVTDGIAPLSPDAKSRIRTWFAEMTKQIEADFAPRERPAKDKWLDANANHRFWAGAGVGLMAVETGDRAAFDWAMMILRTALTDVSADGSMPSEMWRGGKALHYQNFSLQSLAILVSLADANGVALTDAEEKTLARAARFALRTFADPTALEKSSGRKQELDAALMSWTAPLSLHFKRSDAELSKELAAKFETLGHPILDNCDATCNPYYAARLR